MNQIQPMDWSATAAWIALAISIIGTIIGPIVNTILSNRFQLKLRKLELEEEKSSEYQVCQRKAIENFLSFTAKYLADGRRNTMNEYSEHFFLVYSYVPQNLWDSLDILYNHITNGNFSDAEKLFIKLSRHLTAILAGTPLSESIQ